MRSPERYEIKIWRHEQDVKKVNILAGSEKGQGLFECQDQLSKAKEAFGSLSPGERKVYIQKAYTLIYARTGSHERALARCHAGAIALFMRERGFPLSGSDPPP